MALGFTGGIGKGGYCVTLAGKPITAKPTLSMLRGDRSALLDAEMRRHAGFCRVAAVT